MDLTLGPEQESIRDAIRQFLMFRRIDVCQACPQHSQRAAARSERPLMCSSVNPPCQAADDRETRPRQ